MKKSKEGVLNMTTKRQPKTTSSTLIELLDRGYNLSEIAFKMGCSKQNIQKHVLRLRKEKIIDKNYSGHWIVVKENEKDNSSTLVRSSSTLKPIRGHGFVFRLVHLDKKHRFEWNLENHPYKILKNKTIQIIISLKDNNFKIWLGKQSIQIHFPEGYSILKDSAERAYIEAVNTANELKNIIKRKLNISLKDMKMRETRGHFAEIENELARKYNKDKDKLFVRDSNGILWLLIDNSFKQNEIETVNVTTAVKDMDNVVIPYFNDIREHPEILKPSEVTFKINEITNLITASAIIQKNHLEQYAQFQEGFKELGYNMRTHIGAIQTLGTNTTHNTQTINKLAEQVTLLTQLIAKMTPKPRRKDLDDY